VLTTDNLEDFSQVEQASIMVCPTDAYPTEEARWQGVPILDLLQAAGLQSGARKVVVQSEFDGYKQSFTLEDLEKTAIFLALTKENRPMTFDEGGPARIVAPDQAGYRWVRWVNLIEVTE
jgi:DMSO/TMAO reductase YedYZ molybdopterin-dependent catalytic subunit